MSESKIGIEIGVSGSFVCMDADGVVLKEIPFTGSTVIPATDSQEESDDGLDL